jgi:O-antigen/teichoic acid export membrane protein
MKIYNSSKQKFAGSSKLLQWGKLLTITGSKQVFVHGMGLLCGVLIIRSLSVTEYAWYTVANMILGMMTILADGGISAGVMSEGGKVWQDPKGLGKTLATGLYLRRKFAIGSLAVGIPILVYLLIHHGAGYVTIALIICSLVPSFFAALSDSLLEVVPKLHQDIGSLQRNQIVVAILRFIFTIPLYVFPLTFVAILASGFSRIYGNIKLKGITEKFVSKSDPDEIIKHQIIKVVRRILPGAIYYCISNQITIFLMSFFGNTISIGQIGALSRLSAGLTVLSMIFNMLIVPRFARLIADFSILKRRYLQIISINFLFLVLIVLCTYLFSSPLLFILGKEYSKLNYELLLVVMAGCASLFSGCNFALSSSRGWVISPFIEIGLHLSAIIAGILIFNFSQLKNALYYNLFLESTSIFVGTAFCLYKIYQQKNKLQITV